MDTFTKAIWLVILGDEEMLKELTDIMRQQHTPFLNEAQAFEANANIVKQTILERFNKWLDWLPTLPIDQIGLALAEGAIGFVEWQVIAERLKAQIASPTQ